MHEWCSYGSVGGRGEITPVYPEVNPELRRGRFPFDSLRGMICPSCDISGGDDAQYCPRCRQSFQPRPLFLLRLRDHFYWILRRASAGFVAGVVGWFFIPAVSRVLAQDVGANSLLFLFITGVLGGLFLGSVDGMVEESTPKTVRGAMLGGAGGAAGGLLFGWMNPHLTPETIYLGFVVMWAIPGALIGLTSALWEKKPVKLAAGAVSGLIGGGMGGAIGNMLYYSLINEFHPSGWLQPRLVEGLCGGFIGVTLWFFIGAAERFVIFKRRPVGKIDFKPCDHCEEKNPLNAWYCARCGSVLQVAAAAARLNLPPYLTLMRIKDMCQFMSRLSATTGVIAGIFTLAVLAPVSVFLAVTATLLVAVASYSLMTLFAALSEILALATRR